MRNLFPSKLFPSNLPLGTDGLVVAGSGSKSKPKIADVGVGLLLIVVFGSLAMFHALMVMRPQSMVSAAIYAFAAAQGFRFFGKTDSLAKRGALIAIVCVLFGMIIGIG